MTYKKLSDLTTNGQTWSIKAKVIRVWDSINNATNELISMYMILKDEHVFLSISFLFVYIILILLNYCIFEQNDTIHATIWKGLLNTYRAQINGDSIYVFSNFKAEGSIRYRPLRNEKKIVFTYNTKVKEVNEASDKFKQHYFEFVTKDTLLERENKDHQGSANSLVVLLSIL